MQVTRPFCPFFSRDHLTGPTLAISVDANSLDLTLNVTATRQQAHLDGFCNFIRLHLPVFRWIWQSAHYFVTFRSFYINSGYFSKENNHISLTRVNCEWINVKMNAKSSKYFANGAVANALCEIKGTHDISSINWLLTWITDAFTDCLSDSITWSSSF